ncbi:capsular polysaccharide export protein [Azomonas agilis]|uniref:Capsular polysaccharide export protein n=1 Tax=Azomonas agilis TaxID=116849 RepID=A0A562I0X7_9GAMM|nr:capsular biosynthesis protein [Azomonas agilis]TWH64374.1 capsular polysaccharide export protein [Azomonas agilis]
MGSYLFLALTSAQTQYFQKIIESAPGLQGQIITPAQLPAPNWSAINSVMARIDWEPLVKQLCLKRRATGQYQGIFYRLKARFNLFILALRLQALLQQVAPKALIVWNGSQPIFQLLKALAPEDIPRFYFEQGVLPGTTTLDTQGVHYQNSVPRDPAFYYQYAQDRSLEESPNSSPQKPNKATKLPEHYVFIPFQEDLDSQMLEYSPWVANMRALFSLGEQLAAETGWAVVFKDPPANQGQYPDLYRRTHAQVLFANEYSTEELIQASLFMVTVNAATAVEGLHLNRPVVTLGQAFFNIPGVVMQAKSKEDLIRLANIWPHWTLKDELRRSFLHYLQYQYAVPGRWQDAEPNHLTEVINRLNRSSWSPVSSNTGISLQS